MQGHEKEETYGLNRINFGVRTFNPAIVRFDQVDIYSDVFEAYSPYSYVGNSPLIFIDPYGDSTRPVNDLNWTQFDVENDDILLNDAVVYASKTTPVGTQVMTTASFGQQLWNGDRTYYDGRLVWRDGTLSNMMPPVELTGPDVGIGRVGMIYRGVKRGLPYIGKTFNILKRYTKAERISLQIEAKIIDIRGNSKLIRAIEQKVLDYQKTLGKVSNQRNAFNPKRKDYQQYMQKAETWLKNNLPDWKNLIN